MTARPHRTRIDEDGFCVLEGVIPAGAVCGVRDSVLATAAARKIADPRSRLDKVPGLINFDQSFAPYLSEPRLLGLCKALLGEHLRVSYTTCMVTHPGNERGSWHADWPFNQQNAGHVQAPYADAVLHLTTIWMLTPFTADTGTLVVPASHRLGNNPSGDAGVDPHRTRSPWREMPAPCSSWTAGCGTPSARTGPASPVWPCRSASPRGG